LGESDQGDGQDERLKDEDAKAGHHGESEYLAPNAATGLERPPLPKEGQWQDDGRGKPVGPDGQETRHHPEVEYHHIEGRGGTADAGEAEKRGHRPMLLKVFSGKV
jgi:hypothetical protein